MAKNRSHKTSKSLPKKIWRNTIISLGPLVYVLLMVLPWLEGVPQSSPHWRPRLELPQSLSLSKIKFSIFTRAETHRAGGLELSLNPRRITENESAGSAGAYKFLAIKFDTFQLRWNGRRPMRLLMADGSTKSVWPIQYEQTGGDNGTRDGFMLHFSGHVGLIFTAQKRQDDENFFHVEFIWSEAQKLPLKIFLPWDLKATEYIEQAQDQLVLASEDGNPQYFSTMVAAKSSPKDYIEIPLEYHSFMDQTLKKNLAIGRTKLWGHDVPDQLKIVPLLWLDNAGALHDSSFRSRYNHLSQFYQAYLLEQMSLQMQQNQIPNPEWLALYLQLVLHQGAQEPSSRQVAFSGKSPANYQEARRQVLDILQEKSWDSPDLIPYTGIDQANLEPYIRYDYERIEQVQQNYASIKWSFKGRLGMASLLFNYGYLRILLNVVQRAVDMKQDPSIDTAEQLYVLGFLWEAVKAYPQNGIVREEVIRQELRSLLQATIPQWLDGFSEGHSLQFVLDMAELLQDEQIGLKDLGYQLALQVFKMIDENGHLPREYRKDNSEEGPTIPPEQIWKQLIQSPLQPKNITVVPGFWLWTTGSADVYYEAGQPIRIQAEAFPTAQGIKLLLLRGVYFFPQEVLVNGRPIEAVAQIPRPQLDHSLNWYYNSDDKYLAVEIPASKQEAIQLVIR